MTDDQREQTTIVTIDRPLDVGGIMDLATGYWASAAFLAASEVGLFAPLSAGARTADEVAEKISADSRATAMLLDACCAMNLVAKQGDRYMLPSISAAFLDPDSPDCLGAALQWAGGQYEAWGSLANTVRTGEPAVSPTLHTGDDAERTLRFVSGMHQRGMVTGRGVVRFFPLEGARSLLDVGGGPAAYASLLAERYPDLSITVIDLPGVVEAGRTLVSSDYLDRITFQQGDATCGDYGEARYDAVLFSGVLHQVGAAAIQDMLHGACRAIRPGGRLIVSDMMLDATRTQPVFSALFSLQMLLTSQRGGVFSVEECMEWLEAAGFRDVEIHRLPAPLPYTVITAAR